MFPDILSREKEGLTSNYTGRGKTARHAGEYRVGSNYLIHVERLKWYLEGMNRKHTVVYRMSDRRNDDFVPGTPTDRISLVWLLTREVVSLSKKHYAERRLQRHVTRLVRREG